MNTSRLKTFAPAVRRQLMEAAGRKLDYVLTADTPDLRQVSGQVAALRKEAEKDRAALIERVAYIWFNRLAALRFLDARGWHPFSARVLTPATPDDTQPEILQLLRTGTLPTELQPYTDLQRLNDLLDGHLPTAIAGADPRGEAYRGLILAACRYYHALMPFLFEAIDDETELLLPDDLLTATSVAEGFRTEITDEDCAEVEILGWLYQFYISEKKDQVMARKKAVPSEDIPAVTQLFTPHWIVRYLVENSLGRLWLRSRPQSRLQEHMPYYVEDPEGQTPIDCLTVATPEEIKLLDPAAGSGHMLTYAFDLLVKIYEEEGHAPSEIPEKILTHNLFGLEICPRAAQLAQFALVCKAREQSRGAFRRPVQPQVMCLSDVVITPEEVKGFTDATGVKFNSENLLQIHQFREHTETFGSLIQPVLDGEKLGALKANVGDKAPAGDLLVQNTHRKLRLVLDQAEMLSQRYQVVVANPPYMGEKGMNRVVRQFMGEWFPEYKADLFAGFIVRSMSLAENEGYLGFMSPFVWMFIASYENLRKTLANDVTVTTLVQLEYSGFEGATVPVCAFCLQNGMHRDYRGGYFRLVDFKGARNQGPKVLEALENPECGWFYRSSSKRFQNIPGRPFAYWLTTEMLQAFETGKPLREFSEARRGVETGNNERFLRNWYEIQFSGIGIGCTRSNENHTWYPYNKGGGFQKWYGNRSVVINWRDDGSDVKNQEYPAGGRLPWRAANEDFYFQTGITWGGITSSTVTFRLSDYGAVFDSKGAMIFPDDDARLVILGLLNTPLVAKLLKVLNPSLNTQKDDVNNIPVVNFAKVKTDSVATRVAACLARCQVDERVFETSWDFRDLPLLRPGEWEVEPGQPGGAWKGRTLAESWGNYATYCTAAIRRMQELETENNRLWIDAYGLQDELDPAVPEDEITLARADARKDMAAFLSYAVGCMMGRYSLDHPGLILADAGDTVEHYLAKVGRPLDELSFPPDEDAIIPVLEGEWFEDDIVARTREFLRVTFGEDTLTENLRFIEESLGKPLEKYFLTDFYKDHLQTYKKRPIYWLFQSPKKGFGALVYLHRYTRDTVNTLLNRYLRDYLHKLDSRITHLVQVEATSTAPKDKTAARKERERLEKARKDCRDWERDVILPLAQQRVEIDLDDGVKVNYQKFNGAVAPIAGLAAREE